MKQAIEGLGLNSTRRLLEDRPRQLAQVGLVIARWAHVEQAMAFLFDYLLAQVGEAQEYGQPVDGSGVLEFSEIRSTRAKLDELNRLVELRMGLDAAREFELTTARLIKIASNARNVLAHGLIHASDEYPDALVIETWNGMEQVFREPEFRDALRKIDEAYESTLEFHHKKARGMLQLP